MRREKKRKILIITLIGLLLIMAAGYAAFQTTLTLNAKGNIKATFNIQTLKSLVVTSGDGLYKDVYEEERYIYRGADPDNYITFNNEEWRILSIENNETIKIIKNDSLENKIFDTKGSRSNGYCALGNAPNYGCNAWSQSSNFVNGSVAGSVENDCELNIYLNNDYYNSLTTKSKNKIVVGTYNIGAIAYKDTDLLNTISNEKNTISENKIGLLTVSEYIRTSTNSACTSSYDYSDNSSCYSNSNNHNWVASIVSMSLGWLLSPTGGLTYAVVSTDLDGKLDWDDGASNAHGVNPVLYLNSEIKLSGTGTSDDPYQIV